MSTLISRMKPLATRVAIGIAVLIGVAAVATWAAPFTAHQVYNATAQAFSEMSFAETFRKANLEYLPVQEIDDQTFVYPTRHAGQ